MGTYLPVKLYHSLVAFLLLTSSWNFCHAARQLQDSVFASTKLVGSSFVQTSGQRFVLNGKSLFVNGVNLYYLMTRASMPDSKHLVNDILQESASVGVTVVRTWAFADGDSDQHYLQVRPGVYNEAVFQVVRTIFATHSCHVQNYSPPLDWIVHNLNCLLYDRCYIHRDSIIRCQWPKSLESGWFWALWTITPTTVDDLSTHHGHNDMLENGMLKLTISTQTQLCVDGTRTMWRYAFLAHLISSGYRSSTCRIVCKWSDVF